MSDQVGAITNKSTAPVLALDTPSGIDLTSEVIYDPAIRAQATLTLALPKKGLFVDKARTYRGALYLGDIGVPPSLYLEPSLNIELGNIFAASDVANEVCYSLMGYLQVDGEERIWPHHFDTSVYLEIARHIVSDSLFATV